MNSHIFLQKEKTMCNKYIFIFFQICWKWCVITQKRWLMEKWNQNLKTFCFPKFFLEATIFTRCQDYDIKQKCVKLISVKIEELPCTISKRRYILFFLCSLFIYITFLLHFLLNLLFTIPLVSDIEEGRICPPITGETKITRGRQG